MIWKIAKKEFLLNLITFKFATCTVLFIILVAIFIPVQINDYEQRVSQYNRHVADNEAKLRQVMAYRVLEPMVYRRPQVLSVFSQGMEKRLEDSAWIDFGSQIDCGRIPVLKAGPAEANPYLSISPVLDILLMFKIVMSAFALLVAYEAITREREQGTLSLMLSNAVPRTQVLLGKLTAGLLTLAVPTTAAFMLGVLLLIWRPLVALSGTDWARLGLIYVASLIFVLAIYNSGLLLSCLTKSSSVALILGLFFWVLFVVVLPDGSVYLACRLQPAGAVQARDEQLASIKKQYEEDRKEQYSKVPKGGRSNTVDGPFGGRGHWYVLVCVPAEAEAWKKRAPVERSLNAKYAHKFWEVENGYIRNLLRQTHLARNIGRISPACLYENAVNALAGTDVADFQSWIEQVVTYHESIATYVRNKTDDLRSLSFITQSTEAERLAFARVDESMKPIGNIRDREARAKFRQELPKRMQELARVSEPVKKHTLPLNLEDLPQFSYATGIAQSLQRSAVDIALLLLFNLLMFSLSFAMFLRYDVR